MPKATVSDGGVPHDQLLPKLRDGLDIIACETTGGIGGQQWLLVDPIRHEYFRISNRIFQILSAWSAGTIGALKVQLAARRLIVPDEEIAHVSQFLQSNELTVEPKEGGWRTFAGIAKKRDKSALSTIVHSYLFFRIPLFRPQAFLDVLWPLVAFIFTRTFVITMTGLGVLCLWLVSRQWDVFMTSFSSFLTFEGFISYGFALVFVKVVHELGHALMARKYGVAVPTIGVAFIVLFPIMYTDTTAAWRVTQRKRLMVDGAGIFAELTLAVLATLLWVFAPDGTVRDVAFVVATISWVMSLAVNLNPLMRFDGYYIASDALGFENLQTRGFAMGRWRLREFLFGLGDMAPEPTTPGLQRLLVTYAVCTWIYRFFLFLGIALLVYHFAIKLVGIGLFIIEIVWFIALPVLNEIKQWVKRRDAMKLNFQTVRTLCFIGLVLLAFVPWRLPVFVPAIAGADRVTLLFPLAPGQIEEVMVDEGQSVAAGDPLLVMRSPLLDAQLAKKQSEIVLLTHRLARTTADQEERSSMLVLESELKSASQELAALERQRGSLTLLAPHDGHVTNLLPDIAPGQWVSDTTRIALLAGGDGLSVRGFAAASKIRRLREGASGVFVPDEPELAMLPVSLAGIQPPADSDTMVRALFDLNNGPIETSADAQSGEPMPVEPHYRLAINVEAEGDVGEYDYEVAGMLRLSGTAESLGMGVVRRIVGVLIRESGF